MWQSHKSICVADGVEHRLWVGDCFQSARVMFGDCKADLVYTDPPWGSAYKSYSEPLPGGIIGFMRKFYKGLLPACRMETLVWVEVSGKEVGLARLAASEAGFINLATLPTFYGRGIPMFVLLFSFQSRVMPSGYSDCIAKTRGYASIVRCLSPFVTGPGGILYDPFVGLTRGKTAKYAHAAGLRFFGSDRSEERIASCNFLGKK